MESIVWRTIIQIMLKSHAIKMDGLKLMCRKERMAVMEEEYRLPDSAKPDQEGVP